MQVGRVTETTDSTNWSGLGGEGSGIEGAAGQWTVPAIEPSASPLYSATWVGVDGMNDSDLIQTGTAQDTSDGYYAWIEILPAAEEELFSPGGGPAPVEPGDQISAYVQQTAPASDEWMISIEDSTQNWYFNQNFTYDGPGQSAEWIEEAPTVNGEQSTPADFGTVGFSGTEVYGDLGSSGTSWYSTDMDADNEIEMVNEAGTTVLAMPSSPSPPSVTGQSFSDTYLTAPGTPTDLVATAGVYSVYLSWQSPTYDGGTPIAGYYLDEYLSGAFQQTIDVATTSMTVTGLTPGDFYSFSVAAYNAGSWTSVFTVATPPVTPTFGTPTVTNISPISGLPSGGTSVTITGTDLAGAATVDFGATSAASFAAVSPTTITAVSPEESVGTVDVTVTTPGGTSAVSTADQFTYTPTPVPNATTGAATSVGSTTATLNGTVNPSGSSTTYYFEYGTTDSYGSTTSSEGAGSATSTVAETASLTGLSANTTYDFQLVAKNSGGTTDGGNSTFTTSPAPTWVRQSVPSTAFAVQGLPDPVSCVTGTTFCVVLEPDLSVVDSNSWIGDAVLVTTNGSDWTRYLTLPMVTDPHYAEPSRVDWHSVSCYSETDCWAAGGGPSDQPEVAHSSNGGETWTLETPSLWNDSVYSWWPNSIDCVTATTCWLAGETSNSLQDPVVAVTTDGGQTWSTYASSADASASWVSASSLPSVVSKDPNGTYALNGISCVSAISCVAVGGLNEADGTASVVSTTDGGASWSLSPDPTLSHIQELFAVSCVAQSSGQPWCETAGVAGDEGPVTLTSSDGGSAWFGEQFLGGSGWLSSISCSDTSDCWVAGAGTTLALAGTTDGGQSWQATYDDTTNQEGTVSCAIRVFCVATTDGLYVTTDDGGLTITLTQASPTSASVADGAGYSGQLTVTDGVGTVSYSETSSTDSAEVVVSSTGGIAAASSLAPGSYSVSGTDRDTNGDTGTWSFDLTINPVVGPPPPPAPSPPPSPSPSPPSPPSGVISSQDCSSSSATGDCNATNGETTVSASGGGALTLSQYGSDPLSTPSLSAPGGYFDVEVASGSSFASLSITDCNLNGATSLEWWNPQAGGGAWEQVTPTPVYTVGTPSCLVATITAASDPSLSQLTGTVFAAVALLTAPGAPTDLSATAGNASATLTWTAPASDGGTVVTGYVIEVSHGLTVTVGDVTRYTIKGLANGTAYRFSVAAVNDVGTGPSSSISNPVIPAKASSDVTLKLSAKKLTYGDEQTEYISVVVSPRGPAAAPTGTVTVKTPETTLCLIKLASGEGRWAMSANKLKPGIYQLVATYSGSKFFKGSTSAKVTLIIVT